MRIRSSLVVLLLVSAGCALDGEIGDPGADSLPDSISIVSNGTQLNGIRLNGIRLNGIRLNGIRLNGIRLNGTTLSGVSLQGSQLVGTANGKTLSGTKMIGSQYTGDLADGTTVTVRIDDAHTLSAPNTDVWSYRVGFADSGSWFPMCGTDAGGNPIEALALAGRWNYGEGVAGGGSHIDDATTFTFACRGIGALAKCVEWGYKPWALAYGESLAAYHQACTRMVRADYCGDGRPHTVDGTAIDIADRLNIQSSATVKLPLDEWYPNAEWSATGAICTQTYISDVIVFASRPSQTVTCVPSTDACGFNFFADSRTLLINKVTVQTGFYEPGT